MLSKSIRVLKFDAGNGNKYTLYVKFDFTPRRPKTVMPVYGRKFMASTNSPKSDPESGHFKKRPRPRTYYTRKYTLHVFQPDPYVSADKINHPGRPGRHVFPGELRSDEFIVSLPDRVVYAPCTLWKFVVFNLVRYFAKCVVYRYTSIRNYISFQTVRSNSMCVCVSAWKINSHRWVHKQLSPCRS